MTDTPEWHRSENQWSILLYTLKEERSRRGEPVMVNDLMIRIENAHGSNHDLGPIADKLLAALAPTSAEPVEAAARETAHNRPIVDAHGYVRKDLLDALAKERDELKADIVRDRARLLAEVERLRDLARRAKAWFDPYSPDRGQWLHDYKTCMQGKEGNE